MPSNGQRGLYDRHFEHDACGVGLVANLNGVASHEIVTHALTILKRLIAAARRATTLRRATAHLPTFRTRKPSSRRRAASRQLRVS